MLYDFSVQCKDREAFTHRQYRNVMIYTPPAPHYYVENQKKNREEEIIFHG